MPPDVAEVPMTTPPSPLGLYLRRTLKVNEPQVSIMSGASGVGSFFSTGFAGGVAHHVVDVLPDQDQGRVHPRNLGAACIGGWLAAPLPLIPGLERHQMQVINE